MSSITQVSNSGEMYMRGYKYLINSMKYHNVYQRTYVRHNRTPKFSHFAKMFVLCINAENR